MTNLHTMRTLSSGTPCFTICRLPSIPMTILNSPLLPLLSPPRGLRECRRSYRPLFLLHFRPKGSLCHAPAQASFCIFCADIASCILQFVYAPAKKMRDCKGRSRLSARSALQSVSRFEVSTGDPRPFAAGFPIGARAALLAHDFASQSLVCYTFASV